MTQKKRTGFELRPHQKRAVEKFLKTGYLAMFHQMGKGKTTAALACFAEQAKLKNGARLHFIISPDFIKRVWEIEHNKFFPYLTNAQWKLVSTKGSSAKTLRDLRNLADDLRKNPKELGIVLLSVESLSNGKIADFLFQTFYDFSPMITLDESQTIKNPQAKRTKNIIKLSHKMLGARLILSGTPATNGKEDLYTQYHFLNPNIIGLKSFYSFRNRYCIMGGFKQKQIVGYINEDELNEKLSPYTDIEKTDITKAPPRNYSEIIVPLTNEQKNIITDLESAYLSQIEHEGKEKTISVEIALTMLLRISQVISGLIKFDESEVTKYLNKNPKLEATIKSISLHDPNEKVIIWATYQKNILQIEEALAEKFGNESVVTFFGGNSTEKNNAASHAFQNGDARFMVSSYAGARGQTWTKAKYAYFFDNTFSYELRVQAEARNWGRDHIGGEVTYIDVLADCKYSRLILNALQNKQTMAEAVFQEIINVSKKGK